MVGWTGYFKLIQGGVVPVGLPGLSLTPKTDRRELVSGCKAAVSRNSKRSFSLTKVPTHIFPLLHASLIRFFLYTTQFGVTMTTYYDLNYDYNKAFDPAVIPIYKPAGRARGR